MSRFFLIVAAAGIALAQPPPGISRTELLDNPTVLVARLRMEPAARETIHTHPFSAVVMQLTSGEIDMTIGRVRGRAAREPGFAWFIPKEMPHAAVNAGPNPVEFITVGIKAARAAAPAAPPTPPRTGIARETVLDNGDTRVVHVTFAPGSREPTHTHPNDLVTVQISAGRLEIQEGTAPRADDRAPGFVKFVARGVEHSYANVDTKPIELLSVAIK